MELKATKIGKIVRLTKLVGRFMLKTILPSILFCYTSHTFSQKLPDAPNKVDTKTQRQGEWTIYFDAKWNETNELQEVYYYRLINYHNDIPVGSVTDYYCSGIPQWEGTLLKDRPEVYDGKQTWYYETGEKKSEAEFKNNEIIGEPRSYLRSGQPANPDWQTIYYNPALEANESKDYLTAATLFEKALPHVEAMLEKQSEEYIDIIIWLSIEYHQLGNRQKMLYYEQELVSIYKIIYEPGDKELLSAIFNVGRSYRFLKQWNNAEEWLQEFIITEKKYYSGHHEYHGLALSGLGDIYSEQHRIQKSIQVLEEAKSFYEKNPPEDKDELELLNYHLTNIYFISGHFSDGERFYLEKLNSVQRKEGKYSEAYGTALTSLGNFYRMSGELKKAESCFEQGLKILEKINPSEKLFILSACIPMIEVYFQMGQPQFAEAYIHKSQKMLNNINVETPGYGVFYFGFLSRLVDYYEAIGNVPETEKTLAHILSFSESSFGKNSIEYLTGVKYNCEYLLKRSQWAKAEQKLKGAMEAIAGFRVPELSATQIRLFAKLYQQRGLAALGLYQGNLGSQLNDADRYLELSLEMYDRLAEQEYIPERIDVWLTQALINEQKGNLPLSDKLYDRCLQQVEHDFSQDHLNYATLLFAIAKKSEGRNDISTSNTYYTKALQKLNHYIASVFPYLSVREKEMFYHANAYWIENFQSFAVTNNIQLPELADELYNLQLSNKGIVLQSINKVRQLIFEKGNDQLKKLYNEWRNKKNELVKSFQKTGTQNHDELTRLTDEINTIEKKLAEQSNDFADWSRQSSITWKDVRHKLNENEVAVEIIHVRREIIGDSVYVALMLRKESIHPEVVMIEEAGVLENKHLKFYRNSIKLQQDDNQSYLVFWKPIAEKLKGITKVYLSADGVYHQVNIATLFDSETNQYVSDKIDISNVSSTAQVAVKQKSQGYRLRKGNLVAHPDYGSKKTSQNKQVDLNRSLDLDNIPDLPGTETERVAINNLFRENGISFKEWSASDATEENIKSIDNPTVLHIATHGFFLNDIRNSNSETSFHGFKDQALQLNPLLRSGLLMAGCQNQDWKVEDADNHQEDGILTAFEAATLRLDQTELVVLSACETGLGEIQNGEGVYGLQRAFVMAGARQVMMSLWKVDDQATQEFMIAFYQEWLKTNDGPSAMKSAQVKLKRKYPSPYYWGAFVLIGN